MKKRLFGIAYCIAVFFLLCMTSCNSASKKTPEELALGFKEYVTAYTTGNISIKDPIIIELDKDWLSNQGELPEIDSDIIELKPKVEGTLRWQGDHTLIFSPNTSLKRDQTYSIDLDLGDLFDLPRDFHHLRFDTHTKALNFSLRTSGLRSYNTDDSNQAGMQQVKGQINTSDYCNPKEIEKSFFVNNTKGNTYIYWDHNNSGTLHTFVIDSIRRDRKPYQIYLEADWGKTQMARTNIEIPPLDLFSILSANVVQYPKQHIEVHFSDPLRKHQNLRGLIRLNDKKYYTLKYIIDANILKIYPNINLSGSKTLIVSQEIENSESKQLNKDEEFNLIFKDIKPAVALMGKGVIMPSSQGLIFPFKAVNLSAVDLRIIEIYNNNMDAFLQDNQLNEQDNLKRYGRLVLQKKINLDNGDLLEYKKWKAYTIDLAKYIDTKPGVLYSIEIRFRKEYSTYSEKDLNKIRQNRDQIHQQDLDKDTENEQEEWDHPGWYSSRYFPKGYSWYNEDDATNVSYYNSNHFKSTNIISSNLGITAKANEDNSFNIAVANLLTALPEEGVEVTMYNYQNQELQTTTTDKDGFTTVDLKRKPYLLIAKKGEQIGYLRVDNGNSLSLSNFDISGNTVQNGIKGFIYGERGVWRPGDDIFLTFVLNDLNNILPENHPVIFNLINPKGQIVKKKVSSSNVNGFYPFRCKTADDAPTGNWGVRVEVGGASFYKDLKIETVKPNRLSIDLQFRNKLLKSGNNKATMEVKWLHGAIARNLRSNITLRCASIPTHFKGYEDYNFDDETKKFESSEQVLFDDNVDDQGKATININLANNNTSSGMVRTSFITRAFEESGDASINMQSAIWAPYSSFIGMQLPENEDGDNWYKGNTDYPVKVVSLDPNGKPLSRKHLEVKVYKIGWRWWWDSSDENIGSYIHSESAKVVVDKRVTTSYGKGTFILNVPYRNWDDYGRYLIRIQDLDSGHSTSTTVYISEYGSYMVNGESENATVLSINTDKKSYEVGETAKISIPSSQKGRALVSLETGNKVLKTFWVDTEQGKTTFDLPIESNMAPNVYLFVSLIQPHAQTENDLPIRMYGVTPIKVEDQETHLDPVIDMPDKLEPEKEFEITVSEKNNKPMTYTLAIVDDGLLDLTNYKTPDPWHSFFTREALGIKTWDLYDMVMGAFGARLERAFAVGGDENLAANSKKKANRFKPVVLYYGPYELGAGDTKTQTIKLPNYIGSVRTMVVAGDRNAYGSSQKTTPVKKPLMVLGTLPRVVGPKETVNLPVTVFAMEPSIHHVEINIKTNDLLTVDGSDYRSMEFDKEGDQIINVPLKVLPSLGVGKVSIEVKSGHYKASYDVEIQVRNPNPSITNIEDKLLNGGIWKKDIDLPGMPGTNHVTLEVSNIPPINLGYRLNYLIQYPHGCIEQTTSAVFPQLYLKNLVKLEDNAKEETHYNIQEGLTRLSKFQTYHGGFSYWPGFNYPNSWGTSYAGHFMILAEEEGYTIPSGLKENWIKYQQEASREWNKENYYNSELDQAYRLYTLALAGEPELGAMNRLREKEELSSNARWRLAATYALIEQQSIAEDLIHGVSTSVPYYRESYGSYGSSLRDKAMILETLTLLNHKEEAFDVAKKLSNELSKEVWLSTQTTAYCLLAIENFVNKLMPHNKELSFSYKYNGKKYKVSTEESISQIELPCKDERSIHIQINPDDDATLYTRIISRGFPAIGDTTSIQRSIHMSIQYQDLKGNKIDPKNLTQGTDFKAVVTIENKDHHEQKQMALTQIFPSGWEILNTRFTDVVSDEESSPFTYQDIKDDRVYTYFDLSTNSSKTFEIHLNASYVGKYYLPSVTAENMYDDQVQARVPGEWIEVKTQE